MPEVKINHKILADLRGRFGFSAEYVADKTGIKNKKQTKNTPEILAKDILLQIESGAINPSKTMVENFAKFYRVPFLTFFLSKTPVFTDYLIDFRTFDNKYPLGDNTLIYKLKRKVKLLQESLSEIEQFFNGKKRNFVSSVKTSVAIKDFVAIARKELDFSLEEQKNLKQSDRLFKVIRKKIESIGIFVVQIGNLGNYYTTLDNKLFRGISISDDFAPLIVINPNDTEEAQLFSLLHELAHIFLGDTSISNAGLGSYNLQKKEQICNAFAAEFLLPETELENYGYLEDVPEILETLKRIKKIYKVSIMVANRRLYDAKKISKDNFIEVNTIIEANFKKIKKEGAVNKNIVDRSYFGERTILAISAATETSFMSPSEAAAILGIGIKRLNKVVY